MAAIAPVKLTQVPTPAEPPQSATPRQRRASDAKTRSKIGLCWSSSQPAVKKSQRRSLDPIETLSAPQGLPVSVKEAPIKSNSLPAFTALISPRTKGSYKAKLSLTTHEEFFKKMPKHERGSYIVDWILAEKNQETREENFVMMAKLPVDSLEETYQELQTRKSKNDPQKQDVELVHSGLIRALCKSSEIVQVLERLPVSRKKNTLFTALVQHVSKNPEGPKIWDSLVKEESQELVSRNDNVVYFIVDWVLLEKNPEKTTENLIKVCKLPLDLLEKIYTELNIHEKKASNDFEQLGIKLKRAELLDLLCKSPEILKILEKLQESQKKVVLLEDLVQHISEKDDGLEIWKLLIKQEEEATAFRSNNLVSRLMSARFSLRLRESLDKYFSSFDTDLMQQDILPERLSAIMKQLFLELDFDQLSHDLGILYKEVQIKDSEVRKKTIWKALFLRVINPYFLEKMAQRYPQETINPTIIDVFQRAVNESKYPAGHAKEKYNDVLKAATIQSNELCEKIFAPTISSL